MMDQTNALRRAAAPRPGRTPFPWFRAAAALLLASPFPARPNPQGMTVVQGNVSATQNGSLLNISASANSVINWQSFNIAAGETTRFQQPSSLSVVWNRIYDQNPSQIWGNLQANGIVVLMNQNGFYFGPNSSVTVGGFVASSAAVLPPPAAAGGFWSYQGPPPTAKIINYGEIKARSGGSVFLIADGIENHGLVSAPDGRLGLYAGKKVLLSDRPDGRGLSATVDLPTGTVDNSGKLIADAGEIALRAQVVNQNGLIQANSARQQHGVIELVASDAVNLGQNSLLRANGDAAAVSDAGQITIRSARTFADTPGSAIEAKGGGLGGSGGSVEISAVSIAGVDSQLDGSALPGWSGGRLLFDPYNIVLSSSTGRTTPAGTVNSTDPPATGTLTLNVNSAFAGFSQILLQAAHDISLGNNAAGAVWDLDASTGISSPGSTLTLEAGNNINFFTGSRIVSSSAWSVNLAAGVDFSSPAIATRPGFGGIYLNGGPANPGFNGAIETASGNISLTAGHEVLLGSGYVRTSNGGNIFIQTGDGNVDAGAKPDTYNFSVTGYSISALGLGGIGTANGGNVEIHSGQDILGANAHIGAFGPLPGNVTLDAARDIKGNFMLANGVGDVSAGRDIGAAGSGASFGLVNGGWNIHAGHDLNLNEIFNPNGALNPNRSAFGARVTFQFDYATDAYAHLTAGNAIDLSGDNLAHTADNPDRPAIYPPSLSLQAGQGGVTLDKDVILYPSPLGSLALQTADGGSLASAPGRFCQLVLSDSGSADYRTFASGHADSPLHLGQPGDAVQLDISGNIQNVFLRSPTAADIVVHGNALNFSFEGQNLSPGDTTTISIDGDYFSRSDRTFVTVSGNPDLALLTDPLLAVNPDLGARLTYNPVTHQLGLQGIMTAADFNFLLHPTTYVLDPVTGELKLDSQGYPVLAPATFTSDTAALQQLYQASQDIPASPLARNGLQLGGPGQFLIAARNLDLGTSAGIRSVGPLNNPALARVSLLGAAITLDLAGDLEMTSSQIASFNGGPIAVSSLGSVHVGSDDSLTGDDTPKGIYTAHGGAITVTAAGDLSVQGSRIATYDGGDISLQVGGQVDAGAGAKGFFSVTTSEIDPATGQVQNRNDRFFGSGIMTVTRADSDASVGDITVKAGGDIRANSGGILQLAFNSVDQSNAKIDLDAGGSILANQSGILGRNVSLKAAGDITGLVIASQNIEINAQQNVAVTALAGGNASVSGGAGVSGTVVGAGNVSVSGSEISAAVISTGGNATTSGNAGAATLGAFAGVAAPVAQKTVESADKTVAAPAADLGDDDEKRKKRADSNYPTLVRRVGRVTVILPDTPAQTP